MSRPRRRGFTVVIVPTGGGGDVRQLEVDARKLQLGARAGVVLAGCLVALAAASAWALPVATQAHRLRAENTKLRDGLAEVEARLARMEALAGRVEALDDRLRALAADGSLLAGGPLDDDDAEAFAAWIAGSGDPGELRWPGEPPTDRALAVVERAEEVEASFNRVLESINDLEADLGTVATRTAGLPQVWPVEAGTVTSDWGWRKFPFSGEWKFHHGMDIGVPYYTPVVAVADGTVVSAEYSGGSGQQVIVDHGGDVYTRYGHNAVLVVSPGEEVLAGQLLAYSGSSGLSTGPHLHFDLVIAGESVDPLAYLP